MHHGPGPDLVECDAGVAVGVQTRLVVENAEHRHVRFADLAGETPQVAVQVRMVNGVGCACVR